MCWDATVVPLVLAAGLLLPVLPLAAVVELVLALVTFVTVWAPAEALYVF
jgi:hypothetical protein